MPNEILFCRVWYQPEPLVELTLAPREQERPLSGCVLVGLLAVIYVVATIIVLLPGAADWFRTFMGCAAGLLVMAMGANLAWIHGRECGRTTMEKR